jgi:hypothetical protein
MRDDLVLSALSALPRWHVVHWGTAGTSTLLCLWVAGRETLVPVDAGHVTHKGIRRQVQDGELVSVLREVQQEQDADALAGPGARAAQERLLGAWQGPMTEGVTHTWHFPRGGFIRWTCNGRLHIEAGEGGTYAHPMPEPLRDVLVDLGWQAPDLAFRNCWLQPEPQDLAQAAALSVLTPLAAFGYGTPPPFDD